VRAFLLKAVALFVGFGILVSIFSVWWITRGLPEPGKLSASRAGSAVFLDRDGEIIHQLYKDRQKIQVRSDEISQYLKQGVVAIEDKSFYTHSGFSITGFIRAAFRTLTGQGVQGGSTITQQLIKMTYLTPERSLVRKIRELVLALRIEQRLSKEEILTEYLNVSPYGGTIEGVGAAARAYFDKEPSDLTVLEAAILAGIPQRPSFYSPFVGRKDAWKSRTKEVLRRMLEDKYITKAQHDQALREMEMYRFSSREVSISAPHFVFYAKDLAEAAVGKKAVAQGVVIKTTLDRRLQKEAEKIVFEEVTKLEKLNVTNGAAIAVDTQSGEIRSMVGSYDFSNNEYGKFNVVADPKALRQPGSSLKPFLVAMALEKKIITASTPLIDVKTSFPVVNQPDYVPLNYDGTFRGPVQVRFALGNSLNVPMVKLMAVYGLRDFLTKMDELGVSSLAPTTANLRRLGLSVSLGGGDVRMIELASAYTALARGGSRVDLSAITEVQDLNGKVLYRRPEIAVKRVLSPEAAFITAHILSDNNARAQAFGTNSLLVVPNKTVAVKTGTTDDKRDNWAAGFTNGITIITWVGNNDNTPMNQRIASGVTGASPIWNRLMRRALEWYSDGIIEKPEGVVAMEVDSFLGGMVRDEAQKRSEYFISGTEPQGPSPIYQRLKISKNQPDKKANDAEIAAGQYEERDFLVLREQDPISTDGRNRWQEGIDSWIQEQSDPRYKVPRETSDVSPAPTATPVYVDTSTPTPSPSPTP
jgi:penicillin-binding protein 1C